ncbi:MAG: hypothetical protein M1508_00295 [Nitrospirae bacterium]|nr:hypothetical protein [Nitrospirota bacterium]
MGKDDPAQEPTPLDTERNDNSTIESYFDQGVDPDDIPSFWTLKNHLPRLYAFVGLFRGSEEDILVRLLFLMEMAVRPEKADWTLNSLRHIFNYFSDAAFSTILLRLKDNGIISYKRETGNYSVTPLGQKAYGVISTFIRDEDEDSLGMLTGLVYAAEMTGTLDRENLSHLLNRLVQLENEIFSAVSSGSENRILKAREKFASIWKYIEKGTEIIDKITSDASLDRSSHRIAQQIGLSQAKLAKSTAAFQRALNDIEKQKIHLGSWGLSTSDINSYLMDLNPTQLIELMFGALASPVEPVLLLTDLLADIAEYELIDKERHRNEDFVIPSQSESPIADSIEVSLESLRELAEDLKTIEEYSPISASIPKNTFEESAYRLSMLSLIGLKEGGSGEVMDDFATLPLIIITEEGTEPVGRYHVKEISKGVIEKEQASRRGASHGQ